ncbi:MAG: hypothetical protein DHS20C14_06700 [Phycisphaeraceae bacterium]|nr:MAG: hypothetical protein DHS20C14_06700 [Phycisphaeraceae bacterium]
MPDLRLTIAMPTKDRPERLFRCLAALAGQTVDKSAFEVLVGVDGPDSGEAAGAPAAAPGVGVRVLPGAHAGPGATRNRLLSNARAPLTLWLNDDVVPEPDLVERHLAAQAEIEHHGRGPAMVLGAAPWVVREPDRLFDRLIRETSMVFFYDRMRGPDADNPWHDWGSRHAWTLNLSVPTDAARDAGGFCTALPAAAYEDLEWAWRVSRDTGAHVLFRPDAVVHHDHRYEPDGYLERELAMGRDAWALAGASPGCALELFGRDVRSAESLAYARAFVEREASLAQRLEDSFRALADIPSDAVTDPRLLTMLYEHHLTLKRWHWNAGLLRAAAGEGAQAA